MLQHQLRPLHKLTNCVKPAVLFVIWIGGRNSPCYNHPRFLAYRWMYTADGMLCYVTLFWGKENISTNLCMFFFSQRKDLLLLLWRDRWVVYSCSLLAPQRSVVVARAAAGTRPRDSVGSITPHPPHPPGRKWEEEGYGCSAQPPAALGDLVPDRVRSHGWSHESPTGFCGNIKDALLTSQPPAPLLLLFFFLFFIKPQTICLWHQSLKALFTSSRARRGSHSSWATGILCLQYSFIQPRATFPRTKRIQKTKNRSKTKRPRTLFKRTTSKTSGRWRV